MVSLKRNNVLSLVSSFPENGMAKIPSPQNHPFVRLNNSVHSGARSTLNSIDVGTSLLDFVWLSGEHEPNVIIK
jgi:hypothetical protein